MTPQERDVIAGIFDRLKQVATQPRDPEAETLIAERLREQPYAPYAMAQTVYVQEQALQNLQARIDELQAKQRALEEQQKQADAPAQSGGFLSGIFGGGAQPQRARSVPSFPARSDQPSSPVWNTQPQNTPPQGAPGFGAPGQQAPGMQAAAPGPWGSQGGQPAGRGGGFMASALTTAAGVAGGMVVGNMLMNAFKGDSATTPAAESASTSGLADSVTAENAAKPASDTNAADSNATADNAAYDDGSSNAANYQQASYDDAGYDEDPGFGGDDDSWT